MLLVRMLPERWQRLSQEIAKFGTIGVINLIVNFAVFNALYFTIARGSEAKAKAVATIVATTCAYFMNRHWTYRDRPSSSLRREYALFFFFNLVGLVIEVAAVSVAKYGLHQTHILVLNIATGVGIVFGTIFRFWAYRTHVFRPEAPADESEIIADLAAAEVAVAAAVPTQTHAELTAHELEALVLPKPKQPTRR